MEQLLPIVSSFSFETMGHTYEECPTLVGLMYQLTYLKTSN